MEHGGSGRRGYALHCQSLTDRQFGPSPSHPVFTSQFITVANARDPDHRRRIERRKEEESITELVNTADNGREHKDKFQTAPRYLPDTGQACPASRPPDASFARCDDLAWVESSNNSRPFLAPTRLFALIGKRPIITFQVEEGSGQGQESREERVKGGGGDDE